MSAESNTRDVLIAEMLGDIGRLHDSVESLKTVLPGQIAEVETKITNLIGFLSKAGDAYKDQLGIYTNAQSDKVRIEMERTSLGFKAKFEQETNVRIRAAMEEVQNTVRTAVQREISGPVQQIKKVHYRNLWENLALCLICGIFGGGIVFGSIYLTQNKTEAYFADVGRAASASWEKLDAKSQKIINAARSAQLEN